MLTLASTGLVLFTSMAVAMPTSREVEHFFLRKFQTLIRGLVPGI
jgi:hypothetical protein